MKYRSILSAFLLLIISALAVQAEMFSYTRKFTNKTSFRVTLQQPAAPSKEPVLKSAYVLSSSAGTITFECRGTAATQTLDTTGARSPNTAAVSTLAIYYDSNSSTPAYSIEYPIDANDPLPISLDGWKLKKTAGQNCSIAGSGLTAANVTVHVFYEE
jgi:hypothetical protein